MVKAIALVGFYRGDLVNPGDVIELSGEEFNELRGMHKVDYAPEKPPVKEAAPKKRGE